MHSKLYNHKPMKKALSGLCCLFLVFQLAAQTDSLRHAINTILASKNAAVGIAIEGLETHDTLSIRGNQHFPMQSVFKFHIALAVLDAVDKGTLSLKQKIRLTKSDLLPNTWSPLQRKYPEGNVKIPLKTILSYTVSQSDNNGCDILLRLIGGPAVVEKYIRSLGISDFAMQANEEQMHQAWEVQFSNWTTPLATNKLLHQVYSGKVLSPKSNKFLWQLMTATSTGPNRIKGQLPAGTTVAHKTGTSGTSDKGITAAVNDMGIVTLPNGQHFMVTVFVGNSKETEAVNEKIIAEVAKAAWDYFVHKPE